MTEDDDAAWLTAMTTEHFALQSSAASTINEANSRSSIYLLCVSSSLVAFGFTASNAAVFPFVLGAVLPVLYVLGWFTIVRLVDTTIENMGYQTRIMRVYEFYATLTPRGARHNFPVSRDVGNEAQTRYRLIHRFPILTTLASMLGAVNGVLAGAGVAYVIGAVTRMPAALAITIGAAVALASFALTVVYQRRRFVAADARPVADVPARRSPLRTHDVPYQGPRTPRG